jgi:hypothetical protein
MFSNGAGRDFLGTAHNEFRERTAREIRGVLKQRLLLVSKPRFKSGCFGGDGCGLSHERRPSSSLYGIAPYASSALPYPIPSSSIFSSGVPQRRQMIDAQSPQTNGSLAGCWQRGQ